MFVEKGRNIEVLNGYFQSLHYFHPEYENVIRRIFTPLPALQLMASALLEKAAGEIPYEDRIFIGIHVRHGMDVTWNSRNLRHGHTAATADYFRKAMDHFRQRFRGRTLRFIVASDNYPWARMNIEEKAIGEVTFLPNDIYREVDLAALLLCNHTITSTGTFSWWSGYLTGGQVTRFSGWPRPGSPMAQMVDVKEYFPDDWIAIDG